MSQLGKPKSTTGCRTCKSRRVKCDEQKPACARCIKAGRQCLGYAPWRQLGPSSKSPSPRVLTPFRAANEEEDLYFRIFLEDGRKQSVVASDVDFWKTLVPQLSEADPAIRYAAIAVGAFMMQRRDIQGLPDADLPARSALTYYNKSIQEMLSAPGTVKKETALVSNVLYTCLECLQGHDSEALALFRSGRKIFEQYWNDFGGSVPPSPITDGVRQLLARLRILALLYGPAYADYSSPITGTPAGSPDNSFDTHEEARAAFFYLVGDIHELISEGSRAKLTYVPQSRILELLSPERDVLKTRLHEWKTRFWPLLEPGLYSDDDVANQIAVLTLQCSYIIMSIWLACSLAVDECAYDVYLPSFRRLVNVAETVVQLLDRSEFKQQPFSLEIGLIAPLYMTIRKCRDSTVRRAALDLLPRGRKQEGLWEAKQVIAISERVIAIEEKGRLEGEHRPREAARLQATMVHPRRTRADGQRGNVVQFFLSSREPDALWEVWEEWFEA
ncbi:uncharacterized protein HMPREF1541_09393 [Cyphellophora europaea CBS 101466]|uniref:Zn(2)-C6 fungal-type domain-containing protein n=1 Tax=Cyphellophora europaea (strain CBS 101466) TaxID=1220924 RepID=W2SA06_CYPE1|nr:uncharacterized protein HMPREF1541_09393 [Cyphellophora europaea CBS 101466]ETN45561.1 hypothetical protein HMPREF1541_09393 [Cyphellophora europaea CBS 101466]